MTGPELGSRRTVLDGTLSEEGWYAEDDETVEEAYIRGMQDGARKALEKAAEYIWNNYRHGHAWGIPAWLLKQITATKGM